MEDLDALWHSILLQQALVCCRSYACISHRNIWMSESSAFDTEVLAWYVMKVLILWQQESKNVFFMPGRLGLLDYDEVELSNLHRQVLHGEENCGQAKALSAARAVKRYQCPQKTLIHCLPLPPYNKSMCVWCKKNPYTNEKWELYFVSGVFPRLWSHVIWTTSYSS